MHTTELLYGAFKDVVNRGGVDEFSKGTGYHGGSGSVYLC